MNIIMIIGFLLTAYSVIANDVIQTLGTFIASNRNRSWWILWLFIGGIMTIVLVVGYILNNGDVSYGRLSQIPAPETIHWWYIVPPIVLMLMTYYGLPVSTTFLTLSVFANRMVIEKMILKSVLGYSVAFVFAYAVYYLISKRIEVNSKEQELKNRNFWIAAQWISTSLLWGQWLIQDLANIYVFLPRNLNFLELTLSLVTLLMILAVILSQKGGKIQKIVEVKSNTSSIRSATFVDFTYAVVLFLFTIVNPVPMSTTWIFVGILAGRELAIQNVTEIKSEDTAGQKILADLFKVNLGLVISIITAFILRFFS